MENVVNLIIEIDRMADNRINHARKRSEEVLNEAEVKCQKIRRDLAADADKRIDEIDKLNREEYEEKIGGLEKRYEEEKKEMDSFYESHHREIENQIFAEIVGE